MQAGRRRSTRRRTAVHIEEEEEEEDEEFVIRERAPRVSVVGRRDRHRLHGRAGYFLPGIGKRRVQYVQLHLMPIIVARHAGATVSLRRLREETRALCEANNVPVTCWTNLAFTELRAAQFAALAPGAVVLAKGGGQARRVQFPPSAVPALTARGMRPRVRWNPDSAEDESTADPEEEEEPAANVLDLHLSADDDDDGGGAAAAAPEVPLAAGRPALVAVLTGGRRPLDTTAGAQVMPETGGLTLVPVPGQAYWLLENTSAQPVELHRAPVVLPNGHHRHATPLFHGDRVIVPGTGETFRLELSPAPLAPVPEQQ